MERKGPRVFALASMLVLIASGQSLADLENGRTNPQNPTTAQAPFPGLAQAPEVNLFIGAATTSVAFELPPGRKNMTPQLALAYNSLGGPSPYGHGWDLPLGKIQRCGKQGVLSCTDASQRTEFVLSLPSGTVECHLEYTAGSSSNRCWPLVEEGFYKIIQDDTRNSWHVWDKDGTYYRFGSVPNHRSGGNTTTLFSVDQNGRCSYTHAWNLEWIEDVNGNDVFIAYASYDGIVYPDRISYGGNTAHGMPHTYAVDFVWTDEDSITLPDSTRVLNSFGGVPAKITRFLSRVEVRYPANDPLPDARIRWYSLTYDFQGTDNRVAKQGFLVGVTLMDVNDQALSRLDSDAATTIFQYQEARNSEWEVVEGFADIPQEAPQLLWEVGQEIDGQWLRYASAFWGGDTGYRDVIDLNGDGFPDHISGCHLELDEAALPIEWPLGPGWWLVHLGSKTGFSAEVTPWALVPIPGWFGQCFIHGTGYEWPIEPPGRTGTSWSYLRTFDINGDGLADWVDASQTPWKVHLGQAPSGVQGWGFSPTPVSWPAPARSLRATDGPVDLGPWNRGVAVVQDLVDMNADGRPDLVLSDEGDDWQVYYNTGYGFDLGPHGEGMPFSAPSSALGFSDGMDTDGEQDASAELLTLIDMNGDALPDLVRATKDENDPWRVFYNTGQGIDLFHVEWEVPRICDRQAIRVSYSDRSTVRDFFDVNGDGLPDLVDRCGWTTQSPNWQVLYNRGSGFASQWRPWRAPRDIIRHSPGWSAENLNERTDLDVLDIDGDGLVDLIDTATNPDSWLVYRNLAGAWAVDNDEVIEKPNHRPDLLEQIEDGSGGSTFLRYRPSTQWLDGERVPFLTWTVTDITEDDGMCTVATCVGGNLTSHTVRTEYQYGHPSYNHAAREFRGFGTVLARDGAGVQTTTFFHQDGARKGKELSKTIHAAGVDVATATPLSRSTKNWECADAPDFTAPPGTANSFTSDCPEAVGPSTRRWVRLKQSDRYDYGTVSQLSKHAWSQTVNWDGYGNPLLTVQGGDAAPSVATSITYSYNTGAHIVGKPQWVRVSTNRRLQESWFLYDNQPLGAVTKGNVTTVANLLDQVMVNGLPLGTTCPGGGRCVYSTTTYDPYGNITSVTDGNNHTTTTQYDALHLYPLLVTDAEGHGTFSEYDPRCGKQVLAADTTGATTAYEYDTFCRLSRVALPGEDFNFPHFEYYYFIGKPGVATDIVTRTIAKGDPHSASGAALVFSDSLFDALGRSLQSQSEAVVDGVSTIRVDQTTHYDTRGMVRRRFAPYTRDSPLYDPSGAALFIAPSLASYGYSEFQYDALGRPTLTRNPDGTTRRNSYDDAWVVVMEDECSGSTSCLEGGKVVETFDAFRRVVDKSFYRVPLGGSPIFETRTVFTYDGLGRVIGATQGTSPDTLVVATKVTTLFDTLGRKIEVIDPDSGTWRYGYDLAGNVIYQNDPKPSQHVQFRYDDANRITHKYSLTDSTARFCPLGVNNSCESMRSDLVVYTYDQDPVGMSCASVCEGASCQSGRLARVDEEHLVSGSTTQLTSLYCYDLRGRRGEERMAIGVAPGDSKSAGFKYEYDLADHVVELTYPGGEVVHYEYGRVGQLESVTGTDSYGMTLQTYAEGLTYDEFGRSRQLIHGNGFVDERTYGDRTSNYRLAQILTESSVGAIVQKLNYDGYQANGMITHVTDLGLSGALSNTATYAYDGLRRLVDINGSTNLNPLGIHPLFEYSDHLGNMTKKQGVVFEYGNTAKPHQLTSTVTAGVASDLTYDANGNRAEKASSQQAYVYSSEDQLYQVDAGGQTVSFRYNYSGQRVAKIDPAVTRYFGGNLVELSDGWLTKYYFAGGALIASQRIAEPTTLAAVTHHPWAAMASVTDRSGAIVVLLRSDIANLAAGVVVIGLVSLWVAPWRRKRIVGLVLRPGRVVIVILAFGANLVPVPFLIRPAAATGTGPTATRTTTRTPSEPPTQTPTRTVSPTRTPFELASLTGVLHYHHDHLGSVQAISRSDGTVAQFIRYKVFGEPRGYFDASGVPASGTCATNHYCRQFTGYDTEPISQLQYAQARYYDPELGTFLSHDPARQSANPYAYGMGNPVNTVDPTGAVIDWLFVFTVASISAGISATIATAEALANGASVGQAFKAGAISGAIGFAVGAGLGVVGGSLGPAAQPAFNAVMIQVGTVTAARSFENGQYIAGAVSVAIIAYGIGKAVYNSGSDNAATSLEKPSGENPRDRAEFRDFKRTAAQKAARARDGNPELAGSPTKVDPGGGAGGGFGARSAGPTNPNEYPLYRALAGKAPRQVEPGIRSLEGQYVNDVGRVSPWKAFYDQFGRMIGRTDYNAAYAPQGIPGVHHHAWRFDAANPYGVPYIEHAPGEFVP